MKLSPSPCRFQPPIKGRDWWDKLQLIISALSSVALVATGIYISASFQSAQLRITEQNNTAQLKVATDRNASDLRLQELKSATDLLEPLLSSDSRKRQIALVMLPHSLSDETMSRRILFIAAADPDPDVRITALRSMAQSNQPSVAAQLQQVAADSRRPVGERQLASTGAVSVGLAAVAPARSAIFFSSQPGEVAYEARSLNGGLFTYALLRGLSQNKDHVSSTPITLSSLATYLSTEMPAISQRIMGRSLSPYIVLRTGGTAPVFEFRTGHRQLAFVVGAGNYSNIPTLKLAFANSDAARIAMFLKESGVEVTEMHDPTRNGFLSALKGALATLHAGDRLVFYYSGHGVQIDGDNVLLMSDSKIDEEKEALNTSVRLSHITSMIDGSELDLAVWFLDICLPQSSSAS